MKTMGVDLSTKTGVAIVDTTKTVVFTEQVTFPKLTGMPRINAIIGRILEIRELYKPHVLMVEDYAVGKFANSAITSIELGGVLRFICWQESHEIVEVAATTLKKFVTGTGKGKKEQMMLEVFKQFGYSAETNDIADAVGLAMLGQCLYAPGLFTKAQTDAAKACLPNATPKALSLLNYNPEDFKKSPKLGALPPKPTKPSKGLAGPAVAA